MIQVTRQKTGHRYSHDHATPTEQQPPTAASHPTPTHCSTPAAEHGRSGESARRCLGCPAMMEHCPSVALGDGYGSMIGRHRVRALGSRSPRAEGATEACAVLSFFPVRALPDNAGRCRVGDGYEFLRIHVFPVDRSMMKRHTYAQNVLRITLTCSESTPWSPKPTSLAN